LRLEPECTIEPVPPLSMISMNILIVVHSADPFPQFTTYAVNFFFPYWIRAGHQIHVVQGIPRRALSMDVVIQHVDLTVLPVPYVTYLRQFSQVINRDVIDISKRTFSENLLSEGSDYVGSVIVKTDNNCGGIKEQLVKHGGCHRDAMAPIDWHRVPWLHTSDYRVYESIRDVLPISCGFSV
jgi:hypothetical protein